MCGELDHVSINLYHLRCIGFQMCRPKSNLASADCFPFPQQRRLCTLSYPKIDTTLYKVYISPLAPGGVFIGIFGHIEEHTLNFHPLRWIPLKSVDLRITLVAFAVMQSTATRLTKNDETPTRRKRAKEMGADLPSVEIEVSGGHSYAEHSSSLAEAMDQINRISASFIILIMGSPKHYPGTVYQRFVTLDCPPPPSLPPRSSAGVFF
ncbi:hypothetical protein F5146DRAFT_774744 [Armillaria mellea]|nr:hypothetical protein F5146DRAFT_774744 [Armillaria mellea]